MNARRRTACIRRVGFLLSLLAWGPRLDAQQVVPLITFTNSWRYDVSGTDLGTNWRARAFNDVSWPTGTPLFGVETTPNEYLPYTFNTTFSPYDPNIITYYFRTHFQLPGTNAAGVGLRATNYLDDGCVFYLNGVEAGRIRVPAGQNFVTPAGSQLVEGQAEVTNLNAAALLPGDNVLAVEVHQAGPGSSDVAFALSLDGLFPQPLVITNQPRSQTVVAGRSAVFSVGVEGAPVSYQWRRNEINIPGATLAAYTNLPVQLSNAGNYTVVVSNGFGAVVSDDAVLTVLPDQFGPRVLSATVREGGLNLSNRIYLDFDERLTLSTVIGATNWTNGTFRVTLVESNLDVAISNTLYNPGTFPLPGVPPGVALILSTTNWHYGRNYTVTLNRIRDMAGNVIAPDTRLPVLWPFTTNLLATDAEWHFHSAAVFEPDVYSQPWQSPDYFESAWWASGRGPFCGGPALVTQCLGLFQTETGFQPEPSLFRTAFEWPADWPSSATLILQHLFDDGVVFYLNGQELSRANVLTVPILSSTRAAASINLLACITNSVTVTNLVAGRNWLAAAVVQSPPGATDSDSAFGLRLSAALYLPRALPSEPAPTLRIEALDTNAVRLSWTGSGYALEAATNLPASAASPWQEVTNMANPFTTTIAPDSQRFFRLHKPEP